MTVTPNGADGRPAGLGGRTLTARGRVDGPGDTTTPAPQGS